MISPSRNGWRGAAMWKRKDKNKETLTIKGAKGVSSRERGAKRFKDLNFKVDPSFHYFVSNLAAQQRITKIELLRRAISLYVEKFGPPSLPDGF
jgi:hypothetical protein